MIIAIDGPSGAGKSTVARALAKRLGLAYLDTGAMYRAIALAALEGGTDPSDGVAVAALAERHAVSLDPAADGHVVVRLDDRDVTEAIRADVVSNATSVVASHPEVRARLVAQQQAILATGGWVVDGRDIGTRVWPSAEMKIFLTADLAERARRRHAEMVSRGESTTVEAVLADLAARDERDATRATDPLRVADGATVVDSTAIEVDEVIQRIASLAERA